MNPVISSILLALVASATGSFSQGRGEKAPELKAACVHLPEAHWNAGEAYGPLRIIEDPGTRRRWLVERNLLHPTAPGRTILVPDSYSCAAASAERFSLQSKSHLERSSQPIIHSGDSVIVIERTPLLDARLEAIALSTVSPGEQFSVRLKIGGRAFRAIATAPGHATLIPEVSEERR